MAPHHLGNLPARAGEPECCICALCDVHQVPWGSKCPMSSTTWRPQKTTARAVPGNLTGRAVLSSFATDCGHGLADKCLVRSNQKLLQPEPARQWPKVRCLLVPCNQVTRQRHVELGDFARKSVFKMKRPVSRVHTQAVVSADARLSSLQVPTGLLLLRRGAFDLCLYCKGKA